MSDTKSYLSTMNVYNDQTNSIVPSSGGSDGTSVGSKGNGIEYSATATARSFNGLSGINAGYYKKTSKGK
jgi:hypothetical protein